MSEETTTSPESVDKNQTTDPAGIYSAKKQSHSTLPLEKARNELVSLEAIKELVKGAGSEQFKALEALRLKNQDAAAFKAQRGKPGTPDSNEEAIFFGSTLETLRAVAESERKPEILNNFLNGVSPENRMAVYKGDKYTPLPVSDISQKKLQELGKDLEKAGQSELAHTVKDLSETELKPSHNVEKLKTVSRFPKPAQAPTLERF